MVRGGNLILNQDIKKNVIDIAKQIEEENENIEPDKKKIQNLLYQQLIKGMYLNTGNIRQYNPY
jgi:hypothetical protein